ncbi:MAG: 16S rRNA (cytosine(1402)-N(4))-methyltransferase RsmH [Candidatus Competibacterales bacterium]
MQSTVTEHRHQPVMGHEAVTTLVTRFDGVYLDGTFGRGGHTRELLATLSPRGRVVALDCDPDAETHAAQYAEDSRFAFIRTNFRHLDEVIVHHCGGRIDGVLLDLGVSSPQLDDARRGFSFHRDGPLDMRMDPTQGQSAAEWLTTVDETELALVLKTFGEERYHRRIARAIVAARARGPLATTGQLAAVIEAAVPTRAPGKHPATRSFQALRIAVNDELDALDAALPKAVAGLVGGGRLVVIAFHSLEDRRVKHFIQAESRGPTLPRGIPVRGTPQGVRLKALGKWRPTPLEVAANPRARSAVMRAAERLTQ